MIFHLIFLLGTALAEDRPPSFDEISEAIRIFNLEARYELPTLNSADLRALSEGQVVRILERATEVGIPSRAVGLLLTDVPPEQVWVSCQDPHFAQNTRVSEALLEGRDTHHHTWFGLLDLPLPFSDRAWVVDVINNHPLAISSENRAWEHYWDLRSDARALALEAAQEERIPGVGPDRIHSAIFTPTNYGAWVLLSLPNGYSIIGYHSSTGLAGSIPDNLVMPFVHAQLEGMLRDIVERGRVLVFEHYNEEHEADVIGGDGAPIPRFP